LTILQRSTKILPSPPRPEVKLLLACARTRVTPETAERIRALIQNGIDWTALIREARYHGIVPLLYRSLQATCPDAVPEPVLAQLRTFFQANARHNLSLTGELLTLLDLFAAHGIAAIPYKGPSLAAAAYGNIALRIFTDLDILVHQQDILTIKSLLRAHGYHWKLHIGHVLQARTGRYVRSPYLYHDCFERFDSAGQRFSVEIHWETNPRHVLFPLNPEPLWQNLSQVSLGGRLVPTIPPEELLPLLCNNGAKDEWLWLKTVCDVAEFIRANPVIDWERTRNSARILGRDKILLLGLSLASELLEVDLSAPVRQWIETEPIVHLMTQQVCQRLFHSFNQQLGILSKMLFHIKLRESLQDKVRYCFFVALYPLTQSLRTLIRREK